MKRVAESQLTKDTAENEDDSQEPATGFQKADSPSLSARKIRGLPKRGMSAATPTTSAAPSDEPSNITTTNESPELASRFSGFSGFGSSTPSTFTFTPPASHAITNVPQSSKITPTSPGKPFQLASTSQPSKQFSFVPISNPTPPSTPLSVSETPTKRDAAQQYCLSLRGLNTSLLAAITQAVQTDPFVDISEILEKYKSLRSFTQKSFDNAISTVGSHQVNTAVPAIAPSLSESAPSMPTPPASSFGLGNDTRTASPQLKTTGFTPKLDHAREQSPSSSVAWPHKAESKPSSGTEKPKASAVSFGSTVSPKDNTGSTDFMPEKSFDSRDSAKSKGVVSTSFNFKPSAPATPLTPGFSSFLGSSKPSDKLGNSSTSQPYSTSTTSIPSPPSSSGFGFGAGKNSGTSKPFSFGKGSIGNPVGFAFGSPPTTPGELKPPDTSDLSQETGLKEGTEATDGALLSTASHDPSPAPSQGSAYDADGPGEEDEVTLHEIKAHAYKLVSTGDTKSWLSVGKGQLKLKGRDGRKRRLLMRNSNNGQVILNFNLFPGFQTKIEDKKNVISFRVPGDDESASVYHLRVPNEAEAVSWQEIIQKEVDRLLPSHDT